MTYLVSIIITNYNGEEDIPKVINSMQNQTIGFENIELIIVDDKSKDNSKKVLSDFSQMYENIKPIFLDKNSKRPGRPRNIGIKEASADYIMFCDQDDFYKEDFCEVMYGEIKNNYVDLVSSRYLVHDNGNIFLNNNFLDKYDSKIKLDNILSFPEVIFTQANLPIWNKIYRKEFILINEIEFVEDHWGEDFLFSIEVFLKANGIILLNKYAGYNYMIYDDSLSHKDVFKDDFLNDCFKPLEKAKKLILDNDFEYMPIISEFIVVWLEKLVKSNLNKDDTTEILNLFKPWFKEYKLITILVNVPTHINISLNIFIKIISIHNSFFFIFKKVLKHF